MASAKKFALFCENIYIFFDVSRPTEERNTGRHQGYAAVVIIGPYFIVRREESEPVEQLPYTDAALGLRWVVLTESSCIVGIDIALLWYDHFRRLCIHSIGCKKLLGMSHL